MRRIERLHAITNHLRSRSPRTVSAAELAGRFEVSVTTIERDLRSLNDSGVPIYGISGRSGGYALLAEHALRPLQLTAKETAACLAALALMENSPLAESARTAADKLLLALPDPVVGSARGMGLLSVVGASVPATALWWDAVREHTLVAIYYGEDGAPRFVEPYTTLEARGYWYLVGWCRRREGVRGFRTDKIASISDAGERFEPVHGSEVAADLEKWATTTVL